MSHSPTARLQELIHRQGKVLAGLAGSERRAEKRSVFR